MLVQGRVGKRSVVEREVEKFADASGARP